MTKEVPLNSAESNRERLKKLRAEEEKKGKRTLLRPKTGIRSHAIGRPTEFASGKKVDTSPPKI